LLLMGSRDGRMTVRVVMRYLVNKLGLDDDSQVWHACRLPPHDAFFFGSPYFFIFSLLDYHICIYMSFCFCAMGELLLVF